MAKENKAFSKKAFKIKWGIIVGLPLAVAITVNILVFKPLQTVMNNFFRPRVERSAAVTAASTQLCEDIEAEGIVLLKNDNNVLPLSPDKLRVNIFGWSSVSPVYGGTGSGAVNIATATDLLNGLASAGIEYNQTIVDFYRAFRTERPRVEIRAQNWTVPEPTMREYDEKGIFESARQFSNTAIIFLSRSGGEGADLGTTLPGVDSIKMTELPDGRRVNVGIRGSDYEEDADPEKHYLELSNRERAMVERVTSEFENVIVVVNTGNALELSWTDTLAVDSVLWIGGPGESGFKALGNVLTGTINPSGRTVDTFLKYLKQEPTFANFGSFQYIGSEKDEKKAQGIGVDPAQGIGYHFVNYSEGIYLGYRFFETFYLNDSAAYNTVVQYPFGYGLSYTTFEQTMDDLIILNGKISVPVTVTNIGGVTGKEVVQLYNTSPYYEGGIEKAHVVLVAFSKTKLLNPGESETLSLTFAIEDLASYDYQSEGAYVLEKGVYEIKLMNNAHVLISSQEFDVPDTIIYGKNNKRASDAQAALNQFSFAHGDITYLSRANNFANYRTAIVMAQSRPMSASEEAATKIELPLDKNAITPVTAAKNGLKLVDLAGKSYDDPAWETLLDQLTETEMNRLITYGGYQTEPVKSVSKEATVDIDGPQGLSSFMGASVRAGAYPTAVVIASTWNTDMARARGKMMGTEALELGVTGWYGPAMNIHRSSFAGRNFEYYSEDGFLSGKMGAAETAGAKEMGLYGYIKHFALNEQEKNRNSKLYTWSNEQAIREIYLKPFELSVKEGGAIAVMSSFNYIGPVWAGGCSELLNTVLRGEWAFRGMVITDYFGLYGYMDADQAIANGNDLMLSTLGAFGATLNESDSPLGKTFMRTACKNILYTVANSNAVYTVDQKNEMLRKIGGHVTGMSGFAKAAYGLGLQSWKLAAIIINFITLLLLVVLVVFKLRKYKKLFEQA
jgi:beta-glucosidase